MSGESITKMPGEGYSSNIRARFWMVGDADGYLGIGRITLLEKIHALGSINQAAKQMGMSYKKAWRLVEEMNAMFEEPLVIKEHGGKSGGGTHLTTRGQQAVKQFREIERRLIDFLETESRNLNF